ADGETSQTNGLHAVFELSRNGDTLALFDDAALMIDHVMFSTQVQDQTQGRLPDGSSIIEPLTPTPAASNLAGNVPPILMGNSNIALHAGMTVCVDFSTVDPDVPPQSLFYWMGSGADTNITQLDPTTGQLILSPGPDVPETNFSFEIRVRDDGLPSFRDEIRVWVSIRPALQLQAEPTMNDSVIRLRWPAAAGRPYWIESNTSLLSGSNWVERAGPLSTTGLWFSVDLTNQASGLRRYFRTRTE
ncbi:MAG: cadherin repeat domain-containing protein, partial [Verrucomicrobiota bacterium]